jgi:hypothetical protein
VRHISEADASFIETTDSSLSDSIALPSSTSELEHAEHAKRSKHRISPISPTATKTPLQILIDKSDLDEKEVIETCFHVKQESISSMLDFQATPTNQTQKIAHESKIEGN